MGYDMSIVGEIEGEAEAIAAVRLERETTQAKMDALPEGSAGSYFTPEEDAQSDEVKKVLNAERQDKINNLVSMGMDYHRARIETFSVKPSPEFLALLAERDALSEKMDEANRSYFRLNIWGMGRCRRIMWEIGMAKDGSPDNPRWPEPTLPYEKTDAISDAADYDRRANYTVEQLRQVLDEAKADANWAQNYGELEFSDADLDAYIVDLMAQEEWRSQNNDPSVPGVELIKFSSNDGWLVTEAECASAVAVWDALDQAARDAVVRGDHDGSHRDDEDKGAPWFPQWVEFLRTASTHGGFRVY